MPVTTEGPAATARRETWRRLGWFVALWASGVATLALVAVLIRLALGS